MFIKGKCAIYIDKNLRVYENSTVIFVLCQKPIIFYSFNTTITDDLKWGFMT